MFSSSQSPSLGSLPSLNPASDRLRPPLFSLPNTSYLILPITSSAPYVNASPYPASAYVQSCPEFSIVIFSLNHHLNLFNHQLTHFSTPKWPPHSSRLKCFHINHFHPTFQSMRTHQIPQLPLPRHFRYKLTMRIPVPTPTATFLAHTAIQVALIFGLFISLISLS